jgi:hypothetical protein
MTTPLRPLAMIAEELAAAEEMADAVKHIPRGDPLVAIMLDGNDLDVERLRIELQDARSSDVEVSIDGRPVNDHRVNASYLSRIINDLQAAYRAMAEMLGDAAKPSRASTALTVAGTAPGSFRILFRTAEEPLSLFERPLSERALESLVSVIEFGTDSRSADALRDWAATAPEAGVRSMIRLAATLASSHGTVQVRWTPPGGTDRVVAISSERSRSLAADLAGATGREIIVVRGHLGMAQDDPPRVRVRTAVDDHVADVRDIDLLEVVTELIFQNVVAEIVVAMTTSPTTGAPKIRSELLSIRLEDGI